MKFRMSLLVICMVLVVAAFYAGFHIARTEHAAWAQEGRPPAAAPAPPMAPGAPGAAPLQPGMPGGPAGQQPRPMMAQRAPFRSMGPVAVSAAGNLVYVVFDGALYQFQADGLKLVKKVPLYEEEKPAP